MSKSAVTALGSSAGGGRTETGGPANDGVKVSFRASAGLMDLGARDGGGGGAGGRAVVMVVVLMSGEWGRFKSEGNWR